ncbi:uncharacterized protein [Magallana gigas]|uniref:uncharacterized protein n=1 Tax=Magallana gigas TaxID=29159 RepID=UPI00333E4DE3
MRGFQCLLLCVLLYSASVEVFGQLPACENDEDCPDNATCEDDGDGNLECVCEEGFDEVDVPGLTVGGSAVTVCVDLGVCSPLDNEVDDCENGQCVIFQTDFGTYEAACLCDDGYYGELCDKLTTTTTTTMPTTTTTGTTKRSGYGFLIPVVGGGVLLLALLAGGAAAAASSSG